MPPIENATPQLNQWLASVARRTSLYPEILSHLECLRLIHKEGTPLRLDKLGAVAAMGWWSSKEPSPQDLTDIENLLSQLGLPHWLLRQYGKVENTALLTHSADCPETWTGTENGVVFEFRRQQGQNCGLFLDQREHRQELRETCSQQKVLNLFAYTGGFSVYASLGGATHVTTVDLSPKYIEWSKKNHSINGLELDQERYKFYAMDTSEFLKYAQRKGLKYDRIICDPPSHSRNKGKNFQIERDFGPMITQLTTLLEPQGTLLFSTNYEGWTPQIWLEHLEALGDRENFSVDWIPNRCKDFELDPKKSLMKAFHIHNN